MLLWHVVYGCGHVQSDGYCYVMVHVDVSTSTTVITFMIVVIIMVLIMIAIRSIVMVIVTVVSMVSFGGRSGVCPRCVYFSLYFVDSALKRICFDFRAPWTYGWLSKLWSLFCSYYNTAPSI